MNVLVGFIVGLFTLGTTAVKADVKNIIQWRQGASMKKALQEAKKENRPLLVYWGAVWCPPCNDLKSTVFVDKDFIKSTQQFIPVYLDGDTEDAQIWGEKLNAMGYPTLMVLSSSGKEVVRLTTSNGVEELVSTLNLISGQSVSVSDKVAGYVSGDKLAKNEIKMIANFSWGQSPLLKREPGKQGEKKLSRVRKRLAKKLLQVAKKSEKVAPEYVTPIVLASMNLSLAALGKDGKLSKRPAKAYRKALDPIFSDRALAKKHLSGYVYAVKSVRDHLYSDKKKEFEAQILTLMEELRKQEKLTYAEELNTLYPVISFFDKEVPVAQKKLVQKVARSVVGRVTDAKKRHVAVTDAAYFLHKVGDAKGARKLLLAELKTSISPYYLMSTLAYIERENKNNSEALKWYKKAYEASQGGATQLQWGNKYLSAMIQIEPKRKEAILSQAKSILSKHTGRTDSFMGRSKRVLARAKKNLKKWAKDQGAQKQVASIFKSMSGLCKSRNASLSYYQKSCREYFRF